jgi:hypothetical protein
MPMGRWQETAIPVGLICCAFTLGYLLYDVYPNRFGDMQFYLRMAQDPFTFIGMPFGYRLGQPLAAHYVSRWIGLDVDATFATISGAQALATGFLLWHWLRLNGVSAPTALSLSCVHFLIFPGAFCIEAWGLIDASLYLFVLAGLVAIVTNRFKWLCVGLVAGILIKENAAILIAAYVVYRWGEEPHRRLIAHTTVLLLLFVTTYSFIHSEILFRPGTSLSGAADFYTPELFSRVFTYWGGAKGVLSKVFNVFTLLWMIFVVMIIREPRRHLRHVLFLGLVICQMPFATDIERMVALGFPAVYVVAGSFAAQRNLSQMMTIMAIPAVAYLAFKYGVGYKWVILAGAVYVAVTLFEKGQDCGVAAARQVD